MLVVTDELKSRYSAMKNARRMLAGFCILISGFSFFSLSGCEGGYYRGGNRGYVREDNRGDRHYYRDGRWYRRSSSGTDIIVSSLVIGAFIDSLPPSHTIVEAEGTSYYHDDRYYYKQRPEGGYVVVPAPVIIQSPPQIPEMSTINIPNSRGGYTSVTLRRSGNGFVGPQGEYYPNYPSVEQLKTMYGN